MNYFFNELNSDYFWLIDNYEKTTVNISSNQVGNAMIEHVATIFVYCVFQYVRNFDHKLKESVVLNYSIVFKDNVRISRQRPPNLLLGGTFKNCLWLLGTAFKTSHPATVAKHFIDFGNTDVSVAGYPYNGCLCY